MHGDDVGNDSANAEPPFRIAASIGTSPTRFIAHVQCRCAKAFSEAASFRVKT
jgi:hypothetical protein